MVKMVPMFKEACLGPLRKAMLVKSSVSVERESSDEEGKSCTLAAPLHSRNQCWSLVLEDTSEGDG